MPKFVVSTTLKDPEWNNTTVLDSGDATAEVRKLKEEFDGEIQVPGSNRLVQELIAADLVDQINLMIFPVILGTGRRAIEETPSGASCGSRSRRSWERACSSWSMSTHSQRGRQLLTYNQMVVDHLPSQPSTTCSMHSPMPPAATFSAGASERAVGLAARGSYPMSFAAVQKHVAVLERAGLVTKERRGREQLVPDRTVAISHARRRSTSSRRSGGAGGPDVGIAGEPPDPNRYPRNKERVDDERHEHRQGLRQPHPDPDRRLRRHGRRGLGSLGRPGKLEKWWGPPGYPATFEKHELAPGGDVTYFMTSPEGQKHHGFWQVTSVDAPSRLEFRDGFADANGNPDDDKPIGTVIVTFSEHEGGTRMEMRSMNDSREAMQELLDMGAEEGMRAAMDQMDALLAD